MRALKLIIVGVGVSSFLAACNSQPGADLNQQDDDVQKSEETVENEENTNELVASADTSDEEEPEESETEDYSNHDVIIASDALESYEADVAITASLDQNDPERLELYVRAVNGEEPQVHISAEGADRTIHTDGKTYHNNGSEWVDITGDVDFEQLHRITYKSAAELFVTLEDRLEETEEDGQYIYTYSGDDAEIHALFEDFIGVSFGVVDTMNNDNELQIEIDSETMYITYIDFKSSGEDNEGEFSLESSVKFLEFNNVDDIEAPELSN